MNRSEFLLHLAKEHKLAIVSDTGDISVEIRRDRFDLMAPTTTYYQILTIIFQLR